MPHTVTEINVPWVSLAELKIGDIFTNKHFAKENPFRDRNIYLITEMWEEAEKDEVDSEIIKTSTGIEMEIILFWNKEYQFYQPGRIVEYHKRAKTYYLPERYKTILVQKLELKQLHV